jgi:hypothetical protein
MHSSSSKTKTGKRPPLFRLLQVIHPERRSTAEKSKWLIIFYLKAKVK